MTITVGSREQVFHGTAKHTSGGLTKKDLMMNAEGEIVSRKLSKLAKHNDWADATRRARRELIKEGSLEKGEMLLMKKGSELYRRTMEHYSK
jgi:DVNP family